ncbi:MAG TPA: L-2-amino-thiazoline-4-carboxylic acid hydrolase [Ohtaekwangia sp.]
MSDFKKYAPYFEYILKVHRREKASQLLAELETEFYSIQPDLVFVQNSPNAMDKRIVVSAMFLAFIKVLDRHQEKPVTIRALCLEVAYVYVRPKSFLHGKLKSLTGKLINTVAGKFLIRWVKKKTQASHPDGFAVKIITDPQETFGLGYGVDILECGICKLFHKHRHDHYANILCEVDHVTTRLAGLTLFRNGTIANGAAKCDFRYRKNS